MYRGRIDAQIDVVLQSAGARRRVVVQRDGASDGVLAGSDVLVLPYPPGAVDLGVVEPEHRIARRGEDVSAWVAPEGEVTAGVDAVEALVEDALHDGLEVRDVGVVRDQGVGVGIGVPLRRHPFRDVSLHATGVVVQAVPVLGYDFGLGKGGSNGTQVHDHAKKESQQGVGEWQPP